MLNLILPKQRIKRKKGKQNGRGKRLERRKRKAIIDALAAEGATYSEAYSILKSADFELSRRRYSETKDKRVTTN